MNNHVNAARRAGAWAFAFLALSAVAACAAPPSRIQPAAVPTAQYESASCEALAAALSTEEETLALVSRDQRNARAWDTAFNWLLIPGLGALTPDSEEEVAESKGRVLAIQNEMLSRC